MKEGWTYKKLDDICYSVEDGDWIESKDQSPNGIRLIQTGNIGNGCYKDKQDSAKYISEETFKRLHCTEIFKGDILVSRLPDPVGRACILPDLGCRCITAVDCSIMRIRKNLACNAWITYFMQSQAYFSIIKAQCTGSTRLRITRKKLAEILVPVPPLSEQQSIVDYLDSAFAKIDAMKANAEKSLNEAKALFQASLKEMLEPKEEVKWSTIGDLFETYSGGTPIKSNKEYYEGGLVPWLRSGEVCQKEITRTEMFITEKGLKESSAKYYPENTVVVAMYGATAAQVGILRIKSTSNQAVCGILPHKDFLPEFVYYWFSSIEDKLAAQAQGGAQPNISQQKIKKVEIPIYSITEQQSIVTTLDSLKSKVDRLQENYNKIPQECDALKQAILRQVFE